MSDTSSSRSTGAVIALVIGCLLVLPAVGLILAGAGLGASVLSQGDGGYLDATLDRLTSDGVAVTAEGMELVVEPDSPNWLLEALSVDTRMEVTGTAGEDALFIGVAREADLDAYLAGAAHSEVIQIGGRTPTYPTYQERSGATQIALPTDQTFWEVSASGPGTQTLDWQLQDGQWALAIMNADGSPGIAADPTVGVSVGSLRPLALILLILGHVLTAVAVTMIVMGARRSRGTRDALMQVDPYGNAPPVPVAASAGRLQPYPVSLDAELDRDLSRGLWLVKWILAFPHFVVLAFLWLAFVLLTPVAFLSILFTGTYPRDIFDFNVGVLRWSYRVSYYATSGGIGTDRYPPFSLNDDPTYPAHFDVAYPEHLSRGLVLVKWWLLAIPHYIVVGILIGGSFGWLSDQESGLQFDVTSGGGVLGLLVFVAGLILLFTGRYPQGLYDVIIGLNRWVYRVIAYAALMTDEYPPFRLDQGGPEPTPGPVPPPTNPPMTTPTPVPPSATRHDVMT